MRRALLVVVFMLLPRAAWASLTFKWDCYLPSGAVDCAVLYTSLRSKIPFLEPVSKDAEVLVTVTSIPAENGTRYKFDFIGRAVDGYVTSVHSTDKIPSSIDGTTTLVRIMTKLERGLDDFMDEKQVAEVKNGKLAIVVTDPIDAPFNGRREQTSKHWYVAPVIGSYFSDVVGIGINASGNASIGFNYSAKDWRLQQQIGASYTQLSQPVPGTNGQTASVSFAGAYANNVLSRDLTRDHRWSAALLLAAEKNPQANYHFRANASVGLEYDLIPRQTANARNLGLHCAVGLEYENYDAANIERIAQQVLPRELCDVFFNWHFKPVDLSASVGENIAMKSIDFTAFSASLSATWRVTDSFIIAPWVSIQDIVKAINEGEPSNVVYTDPVQEVEASMRAAVQQGYTAPFGIQSGLSIKYVFGNGSLASEDQRWKNATSLR